MIIYCVVVKEKNKNTETGSGKWGDILQGKGSTEDYLDATALGADAVSLVGGYVGAGAGLTSAGLTLASDIKRDHGF